LKRAQISGFVCCFQGARSGRIERIIRGPRDNARRLHGLKWGRKSTGPPPLLVHFGDINGTAHLVFRLDRAAECQIADNAEPRG
jgi:hypothetical protein